MALEYFSTYRARTTLPDHLMTALAVGPDMVIVGGNQGLALVRLAARPATGSMDVLSGLAGANARNLYRTGDYIFVNLHRDGTGGSFGFAVVRLNGEILEPVTSVEEPGVFFEKMAIVGDVLYVTAHDAGIRTYDISDPTAPVPLGGLATGFTDAHAVAVSGNLAYVADGAGGLKVVDVTNPAVPVLQGGEDLGSAVGTATAVSVRDGRIYVAVGGPGLAVFDVGDLNSRQVISTGGFAEDIAWVGDHLAVSMGGGIVVFDVSGAGPPALVARETTARRGPEGTLRICNGIGVAAGNLVLAANWNFMDVYEFLPSAQSTQPDINTSAQRLRFEPSGGTIPVTLSNGGAVPLNISSVSSTAAPFTVDYNGGVLTPGESVTMAVTYDGTPMSFGYIHVHSDDPDESPLPIQVFGDTGFLDPGDTTIGTFAPPLPLISKTSAGDYMASPFTLSDHLGKVVWFAIYGSW